MELTAKLIPQWIEIEHHGEKISFFCAPLSASQIITVRAMVEDSATLGDGLMAAVRYGVRDWRGITQAGETVRFSKLTLEEFFTGPLLAGVLMDLASQIIKRSALTEDERKN